MEKKKTNHKNKEVFNTLQYLIIPTHVFIRNGKLLGLAFILN